MSYIEFAYLIDFLNSNHPEEYVKEILTKELMVSPTIGIDLKLDDSDFEQNYYCRILVDGRCLAYEARPFRCRIYMRDDKMGLCRPLRHIELVNEKDTNKSKRSIWNLNDSLDIPDEFKTKKRPITQGFVKLAREETLDFWIREFLKI